MSVADALIELIGENQIVPIISALNEYRKTNLVEAVWEAANLTAHWIKENPDKAALAATAIPFLIPGIVSAPLLSVLGFASSGPVAGSVAAAIQSTAGNVAARGVFATAQSASMGGYGAVIVHSAVRVGAGFTAAASGFLFGPPSKERED